MSEDKNTEEIEGERGVPSVIKQKKKPNGILIIIGFVVVSAILISLTFAMSGESDNQESVLTEKEEKQFATAKTEKIQIPEVAEPVKLDIPETPPNEEEISLNEAPEEPKPELSAEEKRRLEMERRLLEKRQRSKLVIYSKDMSRRPQASQKDAVQARKEAFLEQLEKNPALNSSGGDYSASLLARNQSGGSEKLGAMLKGTPTEPVQATYIRNRPFVVGEGKMISAVLETAMQSDLPGKVRAVVTHDVYSEDGSYLLIERGSRLVGEYQGGMKQGKARIFALWTRLITPNGIDVKLDSPGTGPLGRSGFDGQIDSHFLERFGASMMLSIVGAYSAGDTEDKRNIELGENFNRSAEIALENSINIKPTIHINQGKRIKVFVNQDLDFRGVYELRARQNQR